jgi:hypothetical protein
VQSKKTTYHSLRQTPALAAGHRASLHHGCCEKCENNVQIAHITFRAHPLPIARLATADMHRYRTTVTTTLFSNTGACRHHQGRGAPFHSDLAAMLVASSVGSPEHYCGQKIPCWKFIACGH